VAGRAAGHARALTIPPGCSDFARIVADDRIGAHLPTQMRQGRKLALPGRLSEDIAQGSHHVRL
jgi:hypothetical protein